MKRLLLAGMLAFSCSISYGQTSDYKQHLSPHRLLVFFEPNLSVAQQADLIKSSGLVSAFTQLPAPTVTICETDHFAEAHRYLNNQPEVKGVSFFIANGKHMAGVLDNFFVKISGPQFKTQLQEKLAALHLPPAVADTYIPNLYKVNNTQLKQINTIEICLLLQNERWCSYAAPNYLVNPLVTSNDPLYNRQWSIANNGTALQGNGTADADMDVDSAWTITTGNSDIKVSIIDSGVDTLHADLVQNLLPGHDAVSDSTDGYPTPAYDNDGHGTCCAGIVGAVQNNNLGISGIAPQCKLIPVRAFYYVLLQGASDPLPYSTSAAFADAIGWSWNVAQADILSNSWGLPPALISFLPGGMQPVNDAIATAHSMGRGGKGAALFFSSGNENDSVGPIWPASLANTIAVNASTMCDERKNPNDCSGENWWGGDHGLGLDFSAPGVKVTTTDMRGGFGFTSNDYTYTFNGTSAACPNAAGVGALVLSLRPELLAEDIRNILAQSCDKVGGYAYDSLFFNGTWCPEMGYGRLNAFKALQNSFNYSSNISIAEDVSIHIFPNPAQSHLQVWIPGLQTGEIKITDISGKLLMAEKTENERTVLDIASLANGVYVVQAQTSGRVYTRQMSIVK